MPEWEVVLSETYQDVCRLEVPGGYIYRVREMGLAEDSPTIISTVFVPCEVPGKAD
jgi:hypothetical protein